MMNPAPLLVALTGGPGAGKTAVLEVVRRHFCDHVAILPESASIVFAGGFPRRTTMACRKGAQRAIFHVQRELERVAIEEDHATVILCDRGTLDGLAYWPGEPAEFMAEVGSSLEGELSRYSLVIHLRTPPQNGGYNHKNPLRTETAAEAAKIDAAIDRVWSSHPHRHMVPSSGKFIDKVAAVLEILRREMPVCCLPALSSADVPRG